VPETRQSLYARISSVHKRLVRILDSFWFFVTSPFSKVNEPNHIKSYKILREILGGIATLLTIVATERGNSIYVFAMDSLAEDVEGLQKTVSKAQMVATGKPVAFTAAAVRDSHSRREGVVEQWDSCD
jgi:hypothetical protein